jgi:hypothetical protein
LLRIWWSKYTIQHSAGSIPAIRPNFKFKIMNLPIELQIELQNLKPISYYEEKISVSIAKLNETNNFLNNAVNETEINFGNKMKGLLLKDIYHSREIVMYIRKINNLIQPMLN